MGMAAVAGDAENINKQARNTRTNWLNSPERQLGQRRQEQASGRRPPTLGPSGGCPRRLGPSSADGPLHPSRTDHVVPTLFM